MQININFESEEPIYNQLAEQIIAGIAKNELQPGERLPSVRSLAADIGINLHTVNKAYQQLRDEGFILNRRQRGVIIHPDGPPLADGGYKEDLTNKLHPMIAKSICRGMNEDDFIKLCSKIFNDFKDGDNK